MISCVAVDDESWALQLIEEYVSKIEGIRLVETFSDPVKAKKWFESNQVDLVFMDINMPGLTGLELARLLKAEAKVIFTTAYEEFAVESYRVKALDYLLKPFSQEEFQASIKHAIEYFELLGHPSYQVEEFIFVKSQYKLERIVFNQLLYVENIKDYVRFHMNDGRKNMSLMSLKSTLEMLPGSNFIQIHRSFIVNLDFVKNYNKNELLIDGKNLPISRKYKNSVYQRLQNYPG